jgi:hypothetical protein
MQSVVEEKATFLPNPDVKREQCVEECIGCNKMYSDSNIGDVCIAYVSPKAVHRMGCALASNKKSEATEGKKKINPLKASKRGRR